MKRLGFAIKVDKKLSSIDWLQVKTYVLLWLLIEMRKKNGIPHHINYFPLIFPHRFA
jgi:hypothetical protein